MLWAMASEGTASPGASAATGTYGDGPAGDSLLTMGNTAKLYCLDLLMREIERAGDADYRIVDLGCGNALHFRELLRRYRTVRYVGVEPDPEACAVAEREL